ncbi:hypothetical protein HD554DRAFT_1081364 [Boletus coccyginus]|nr:hypothetical protein HD554DRAFT_1081364 [Boletus coccyginus]
MSQFPSDVLKVGVNIDAIDNRKGAIEIAGDATDAIGIDTKVYARVLRKVDWHVLPLILLLYSLSFSWVTVNHIQAIRMLLTSFAMWDYDRLNKRKDKLCREHGITGDFREDGDDSPLFRCALY